MQKILILMVAMLFFTVNIAMAAMNINTASKEDLASLSGIGEKKAEAIIDYRKAHGDFKNSEDLMKVKGIGPKIYQAILKEVTL